MASPPPPSRPGSERRARSLADLAGAVGRRFRDDAPDLVPVAALLVLPFALLEVLLPGVDDFDGPPARTAAFAAGFVVAIVGWSVVRSVLVARVAVEDETGAPAWRTAVRRLAGRAASLFVVGLAALAPQSAVLLWAAFPSLVAMFGWLLFLFAIVFFPIALAVLFLFLAGWFFFVWLLVSWSVAIPVALFEDLPGGEALRRSRRLVRPYWFEAAVVFVVPNALAAYIGDAVEVLHRYTGGELVTHVAIQAVMLPLTALASVALYRELVARADSAPPPPQRTRPLRAEGA